MELDNAKTTSIGREREKKKNRSVVQMQILEQTCILNLQSWKKKRNVFLISFDSFCCSSLTASATAAFTLLLLFCSTIANAWSLMPIFAVVSIFCRVNYFLRKFSSSFSLPLRYFCTRFGKSEWVSEWMSSTFQTQHNLIPFNFAP